MTTAKIDRSEKSSKEKEIAYKRLLDYTIDKFLELCFDQDASTKPTYENLVLFVEDDVEFLENYSGWDIEISPMGFLEVALVGKSPDNANFAPEKYAKTALALKVFRHYQKLNLLSIENFEDVLKSIISAYVTQEDLLNIYQNLPIAVFGAKFDNQIKSFDCEQNYDLFSNWCYWLKMLALQSNLNLELINEMSLNFPIVNESLYTNLSFRIKKISDSDAVLPLERLRKIIEIRSYYQGITFKREPNGSTLFKELKKLYKGRFDNEEHEFEFTLTKDKQYLEISIAGDYITSIPNTSSKTLEDMFLAPQEFGFGEEIREQLSKMQFAGKLFSGLTVGLSQTFLGG